MKKPFYANLSLWSLIFWNLVYLIWALKDNWSLTFIMAIYLCQNLIFGFWWFLKMGSLTKLYKLEHLKISMEEGCYYFFLVYLICHAVLFRWLTGERMVSIIKWPMFIMAGMFGLSQWFSFYKGRMWISKGMPSIITIIFPYIRFLPVVGMLIIAKSNFAKKVPTVIFLLLKTLIDVILDVVERKCSINKLCQEIFFSRDKFFLRDETGESKECEFCGRMISELENSYAIKKHIVCKQCYEKIEQEKEKL